MMRCRKKLGSCSKGRRQTLRGVSKTFGEWYQKTNKTEDKKQINFSGLQNNRHPSQRTVGNVHKASGNCPQRPL
jgi:hypothetical protein